MKLKLLIAVYLISLGCYAQLPVEGFEGSFPPPGWTVNNVSGAAQSWQHTIENVMPAYQGAYAALINGEDVAGGTVAEDWLISPAFTVPTNGQLQFYSQLSIGGTAGTYKIMLGTNPTDINSFTELQSWGAEGLAPEGAYTQRNVALPVSVVGEQRYIAFVAVGDAAHAWLIDNVSIQTGCNPPTNLVAANITTTAADIAWQSGGTETAWEIEVVPQGSAPTGTGIPVTVNPWSVTGLAAGECYDYYVRAVCGPDEQSAWAGPLTFCLVTGNTIEGTLRFDANGDGICNSQDLIIPNTELQVGYAGLTSPLSVYTDSNGQYSLTNLPAGTTTYSLQPVLSAEFTPVAATAQQLTFTGQNTAATLNVCIPAPTVIVPDVDVTLVPLANARPGFTTYYRAMLHNNSVAATTGAITLTVDFNSSRMQLATTGSNITVNGNTITITLTDGLESYGTSTTELGFIMGAPPVNALGDTITFTATASYAQDTVPGNNTYTLEQTMVNSLDPNDITVHQGPEITLAQVADYLTYTIHFQNTGTAAATTVKITDQLDIEHNWETFLPVTASHNYTVSREDARLTFTFNNINLAASTVDEAASHGFVTFKVKPLSFVDPGTYISTNANIYFDFNAPITTNYAVTRVVNTTAGVTDSFKNNIALYPNPVSDVLNIRVTDVTLQSVSVYDLNGRLCLTSASQQAISMGRLMAGLYMVAVVTDKGIGNYKLIKQ